MDSLTAFEMGRANRNKELMVFDWHKAAKLIKESNCKVASAGLQHDWEWTGGKIFEDGKPLTDRYTFLSSTWAIPEIEIDGNIQECYIMQSESPDKKWDNDTKWPKSALEILK